MMNQKFRQKLLQLFRVIGIAEGISFLLLLLVAMPMKYLLKIPEPVKYTGWVHGVLFVGYISLALSVFAVFKKNIGWLAIALLASFIPTGTFILDRQLKKDAAMLT